MLKNIKLLDFDKNLERGSILRCKGKTPYETYVDFMVIESYHEELLRYSLLVLSGYKAGLTYTVLPQESIPNENEGYAVNVEWLKENWNEWGYFDCPLNDVYIVFREPPIDFFSY